jgi:AraC family transcriptional regulator of adaptative response/methylated-DNA-[protein]-cysteine methyltransferase
MLKDAAAWRAVVNRDERLDGSFVYAVASTGVFCRPSCPSRRPSRKHVRFFSSADDAEQHGFRACLRCAPRSAYSTQAQRVQLARQCLDSHFDERFTLKQLAQKVGMGASHLQRSFKRQMGMTPKEYAHTLRLKRLKTELKKGESVTTAIYEAGYGSSSRVYEHSNARLGMTPSAYRRGGDGMSIRFAVAQSPLGRLLVGTTERGVCSVMLGSTAASLEAELRREYPKASIERAKEGLNPTARALVRYAVGTTKRLNLPIDVQATAFQWKVWRALQAIPYGRTCSYAQVAAAIGAPTAVRAVARACASNRVALLIPCHRVVRSDGQFGGYRWGAQRKRKLLEQERQRVKP